MTDLSSRLAAAERFLKWIGALDPSSKLIRVKSWLPEWDSFTGAIAWPTMLIDRHGYRRETTTPLWTRARFKRMLRHD